MGANNGLLANCEIVSGAPIHLKQRALRLVAGKVTLAARVNDQPQPPHPASQNPPPCPAPAAASRWHPLPMGPHARPPLCAQRWQPLTDLPCLGLQIDSFHQYADGKAGEDFRDGVNRAIDKLQEPPPPKQAKPLSIPGEGLKKKRGGKRYRKMKEKYAMTDARKLQNRMVFGKVMDDDLEGKDMGMLGMKSGNGRVRGGGQNSKTLQKAIKKQQKRNASSSGATSGLSSSLAFTPVQGLELENPNARAFKQSKSSKYFSSTSVSVQRLFFLCLLLRFHGADCVVFLCLSFADEAHCRHRASGRSDRG